MGNDLKADGPDELILTVLGLTKEVRELITSMEEKSKADDIALQMHTQAGSACHAFLLSKGPELMDEFLKFSEAKGLAFSSALGWPNPFGLADK